LLHHGTFLCDFDLGLMERYLKKPAREPAYRRGRSHGEFVANLPLSAETIRARLSRAWPLVRTSGQPCTTGC
jgi:lipoate-protein ligase A